MTEMRHRDLPLRSVPDFSVATEAPFLSHGRAAVGPDAWVCSPITIEQAR